MLGDKRNYNLQKRALSADQTRLRIVESARLLLSETGYPNVSLDEIADKAGVSRQTIYVQFGSKRGVLAAVAEYIEHLAFGPGDIVEQAYGITNPVGDLHNGIKSLIAFHSENSGLLRTFVAQAAYDADFREVWFDVEERRRQAIRVLVEHLFVRHLLVENWTRDEAADWLWSMLSFEVYDQLITRRGWTAKQLAKRLQQMIDTMLLTNGTPQRNDRS